MALYAFTCLLGHETLEQAPMDQIPSGVLCAVDATTAKRRFTPPRLVMVGAGFAATPAIMRDPIAAGHPQRNINWGMEDPANYLHENEIDQAGDPMPAPIDITGYEDVI